MEQPELSIIIVNYNVKLLVEQCLLSVRRAVKNITAEIFVVDNNSSDGSVEYLKPKFPEITFIQNKNNPGFSKANNQAIRQAKGKYVLLLNPDTVIGENTLQNTCQFMKTHVDAGGIGVKMINASGRFLPESKRSYPSPWNSFCKMFGLSYLFPKSRCFAKYQLKYLDENQIHKVEVLSGAFMLLRQETLKKIGLLDERFFMYGEDIDLSYRIILGGYTNYYLPENIIHYKGESTRTNDITYIKTFYNAMLLFFKKYYPRSGYVFSTIIYIAIYIRENIDLIHRSFRQNKKRKDRKRNLLIITEKKQQEQIVQKCHLHIGKSEKNTIKFYENINEARAQINTKSKNKHAITDIIMTTDNQSFSEIIHFMDNYPDKTVKLHLYNRENDLFISPKE